MRWHWGTPPPVSDGTCPSRPATPPWRPPRSGPAPSSPQPSPAEAAGLSPAVARHHGVLVLARARDPPARPSILADKQTPGPPPDLGPRHARPRPPPRPGELPRGKPL